MPYRFVLPHVKESPADPQGERLWMYFGIDQGISIIKDQTGAYTQVRWPSTDEINASLFTYIGGHEYIISNAEFDELSAAGYGANLTAVPDNTPLTVYVPPAPVVVGGGGGGGTPPVVVVDPGPGDSPAYGAGAYGAGIYGA